MSVVNTKSPQQESKESATTPQPTKPPFDNMVRIAGGAPTADDRHRHELHRHPLRRAGVHE